MRRAPLVLLAILLAGCSAPSAGEGPTEGTPAPSSSPIAPAGGADAGPDPAIPAPDEGPFLPPLADSLPTLPVDQRTLAYGNDSRVAAREVVVVNDSRSWRELWARHSPNLSDAPNVDFRRERVVALFLGEAPCRHARVGLVDRAGPGELVATTDEWDASGLPGCDPTSPARPYHFVRFGDVDATLRTAERSLRRLPPDLDEREAGAPDPGLRTLGEGSRTALGSRREVVGDESRWRELWARHAGDGSAAPAVDFAKERVFVVVLRPKPNACWSVRVESVALQPPPVEDGRGTLRANLTTYAPGPATECPYAPSTPYHFVAFPHDGSSFPYRQAIQEAERAWPPP